MRSICSVTIDVQVVGRCGHVLNLARRRTCVRGVMPPSLCNGRTMRMSRLTAATDWRGRGGDASSPRPLRVSHRGTSRTTYRAGALPSA